MADAAKSSELSALRAEYKALTGKNPSPRLDAPALRAKIAQSGDAGSVPASAAKPPAGTAYLDHDDPAASASYLGAEIVRGAEGLFLVPIHAVEQLIAHGFRLIRSAE